MFRDIYISKEAAIMLHQLGCSKATQYYFDKDCEDCYPKVTQASVVRFLREQYKCFIYIKHIQEGLSEGYVKTPFSSRYKKIISIKEEEDLLNDCIKTVLNVLL